jgi:hypothetical protein
VEKVSTRLPAGMKALLDQCITRELYGDQAMTVRHFITIGLERLVEEGRLLDPPITKAASTAPPLGPDKDGA